MSGPDSMGEFFVWLNSIAVKDDSSNPERVAMARETVYRLTSALASFSEVAQPLCLDNEEDRHVLLHRLLGGS